MPLKLVPEDPPTLNLTSMIDVLFLLIIFFMAATEFTELERQINLQIPRVGPQSKLPSASSRHELAVFRNGVVRFDQQPVTLADLPRLLADTRRSDPEMSVLVRGDGEGTFQNVAQVLAACREAGITELGISVRLAQEAAPTTR